MCAGAVMLASGIGDAPALSPEDAEMACEDAELAERATGEAPGDDTAMAGAAACGEGTLRPTICNSGRASRSEEHTSELQSLMRISYAVFCLKKKKKH